MLRRGSQLLHSFLQWMELDGHMQEVLQGASVALALKGIGAGMSFLFSIAVGRMLGVSDAGLFFLALSLVKIGSVVGKVGLDNTILRFTAQHAAAQEWAKIEGLVRLSGRISICTLTAASAMAAISSPLIAKGIFGEPELAGPLRAMSLAIVPLGLLELNAQVLRGLKEIAKSVAVQSVLVPLFSVVLIVALAPRLGVLGGCVAYLLAAVCTFAVGARMWAKSPARGGSAAPYSKGDLWSVSRPLYIVALFQLALIWANVLLLGALSTSDEVGIFTVSNRTAQLLTFFLLAVNTIVAPKFAALHRAGDHETLGDVARKCAAVLSVIGFPLVLVLVLWPDTVLLLFGSGFDEQSSVLTILAIGQYVNVITGSVGTLLMMAGEERLMRDAMIVAAIATTLLGLVLIPPFGATGAAVATAITLAGQNVVLAFAAWWKLGIVTIPIPVPERTR